MPNLQIEEQLVKTFVEQKQCRRILATINSPKGRKKFIKMLSHSLLLNPKHSKLLPNKLHSIEKLCELLANRTLTTTCYVISENSKIDGTTLSQISALEEIFNTGTASILSCEPENLALYLNEDISECYLLHKQ